MRRASQGLSGDQVKYREEGWWTSRRAAGEAQGMHGKFGVRTLVAVLLSGATWYLRGAAGWEGPGTKW